MEESESNNLIGSKMVYRLTGISQYAIGVQTMDGSTRRCYGQSRKPMAIFLARTMLSHSNKSNSRTERGVALSGFLIFKDVSPHSTDAFLISVRCLIIVAKVNEFDVEILRSSAKAFYGRMQCLFQLISGPGRRRSTGPLGAGKSKFITRKSSFSRPRAHGRPPQAPSG
ncbi:hypothetical protein TNCV_2644761 [Trichonephila clavipes]|nr:hypothetical protein TNCV_2644761 [Trichonephila clavipes]